eukprot:Ihof_evm6s71 gene=Ihof_evmTU6s71
MASPPQGKSPALTQSEEELIKLMEAENTAIAHTKSSSIRSKKILSPKIEPLQLEREKSLSTLYSKLPTWEEIEASLPASLTPTRCRSQAHEDSLVLWGEMIKSWPKEASKCTQQAQAYIDQGVPNALRILVWQLLANTDTSPNKRKYSKLLEKKCPHEDIIKRDVSKLLGKLDLLEEVDATDMLCRFLRVYSQYDLEMGYCPRLIDLSALLLGQMPEEDAFALMVALMENYHMRDLFLPGSARQDVVQFQFTQLLHEEVPELVPIFTTPEVESKHFLLGWLTSAFANALPRPVSLHIMDYILACSCDLGAIPMLMQIGLAVMQDCRVALEGRTSGEVIHYLQHELAPQHSVDAPKDGSDPSEPNDASSYLIRSAMKYKVSRKRLRQLEKAYDMEMEAHLLRTNRVTQLEEEIQTMTHRLEELNELRSHLLNDMQKNREAITVDLANQANQCEQYDILLEQLRQENSRLFTSLSLKDAQLIRNMIAK